MVFQLRKGTDTHLVGRVPTLADDGVRQAWHAVGQEHQARAHHVVGLHTEWQPTPADAAFIAATFPGVTATHHFVRPAPDGWEDAFAAARITLQAELRPVLWSASSSLAGQLVDIPHWPVASGQLHLALAVVTPSGTYHVTHEQLGDVSFDALMADVCRDLVGDLAIDTRPDGVSIVAGRLVAAVACLPGFYQRVSEHLGAEVLVVGVLSPDLVHVASADGAAAEVVAQAVRDADTPPAEVVPCLLSILGDRIEVAGL